MNLLVYALGVLHFVMQSSISRESLLHIPGSYLGTTGSVLTSTVSVVLATTGTARIGSS
jgi:hypothetical protein